MVKSPEQSTLSGRRGISLSFPDDDGDFPRSKVSGSFKGELFSRGPLNGKVWNDMTPKPKLHIHRIRPRALCHR
ncbi:BQ5605_C002g01048 [Microbotryum silenes-dioicae]|uniref:BQ5605_C002g01048 protein n=1 Tax=Microbotryum silenes-dioicae TaxID=796604 RepID=A0A2X0P0X4_9BASI|nr:BQ5605_C002g01048 [Microbotryum silenes-dioicae]